MTIYKLLEHYYKYKDTLVYNITSNTTYYDIYKSLDLLIDLIAYQCNYNVQSVIDFMCVVYSVCEKENGKRNTIFLNGPPNCGKSYFTYTLAHFFINYGNVESPHKNSTFPFMDCSRKRILVWDEAFCDRQYYESFKKLMSGEPFSVSVKFQCNKIVHKTPLIITSSGNVFTYDEMFNCRMHKCYWKSAPFLNKSNTKTIHPASVGILLAFCNMYKQMKRKKAIMPENIYEHIRNKMCIMCYLNNSFIVFRTDICKLKSLLSTFSKISLPKSLYLGSLCLLNTRNIL